MIKTTIVQLMLAILLYSCNSAEDVKTNNSDSAVVAVDSVTTVVDTTKARVDTTIKNPTKPVKGDTGEKVVAASKKKAAVLGYSYFTDMKQDETRSIYAQVRAVNVKEAIDKLSAQIKEDLQSKNTQVMPERKSDTATYLTGINVYYYKWLTITLNDPDSNFRIDSLDYPQRQLIDTADGEKNLWQWAVTPKTSVHYARLYLKVVAEKEDGTISPIDSREFNISIQLETNFWRSLVDWLRKNPEKLLVLILIPIVSYFGKKIFDRYQSKNNNGGGNG
jgi:hypothetical protein